MRRYVSLPVSLSPLPAPVRKDVPPDLRVRCSGQQNAKPPHPETTATAQRIGDRLCDGIAEALGVLLRSAGPWHSTRPRSSELAVGLLRITTKAVGACAPAALENTGICFVDATEDEAGGLEPPCSKRAMAKDDFVHCWH